MGHRSGLRGPAYALGAAFGAAISVPLGKLLLGNMDSFTLAGILYFGSGVGLAVFRLVSRSRRGDSAADVAEASSGDASHRSRLALIGAIVSGGVLAPALFYWGLNSLAASTASLLLSLEVVFTALLAGILFRERVTKHVWAAVALMVVASVVLSSPGRGFSWSFSALGVVCAALFWGLDNNLTTHIHGYSAAFIVEIKGLVAGSVNLLIGVVVLGHVPDLWPAVGGVALGVVSYGFSLFLFVLSLRALGAARGTAYFSSAPVFGALMSLAVFAERPGWPLAIALALVVVGILLMILEPNGRKPNSA